MKTLTFLFILISSGLLHASSIDALRSVLGHGVFQGQTESGEKCSVEIDQLSSHRVRIYLLNPRIQQFEFGHEDEFERLDKGVRISSPSIYEDNARITNRFVVDGRVVGIEREFCTYKCWISMRPCILYR